MCRNHEHPCTTTPGDRSTANEILLRMAHGSLVAGMISKSDSGRSAATTTTTTAAATGSSSPVAAGHNSAKMGSRRIFTPQFKLQVLDSYRNDGDCKGNQRATARKYGIHRRQIQKWLQVENNLRSVVANGGSSAGAVAAAGNATAAAAVHSASNGGGAAMKINILNHHHLPHHPAPPHHHLHYQQQPQQHHHHHHHAPSFHHPGLASLMQAPSVAAGLPAHYHHHMQQQQQQQQHQLSGPPPHPLAAAFHPIVALPQPPQSSVVALNSIDLKVAGLDSARHRVARNGASACIMSPVLTHTSATAAAAAIPVSSCSPLSIASSSGASLSSSLSSSSPSSLARSPSASLSSQHQQQQQQQHQHLHSTDPVAATSGGDSTSRSHQSVIFSPVPLLAAAAANDHHQQQQQQQQYYNYYGHIRAVAAAAQAAAAAAAASAATVVHRYDHPIDLSRPDRIHSSHSPAFTELSERHGLDHSLSSDHEDEDEEEVEISVDEPADSSRTTSGGLLPTEADRAAAVEQAWDLSCRRSTTGSERKRSSSQMSGTVAAPETSRPPKSVKLFKPYLLDNEEREAAQELTEDQLDDKSIIKRRRDSALADEDKDSSRASPAISDHLAASPAEAGDKQRHHYPIIWSNNNSSSYYEHFYEFSAPLAAHPLVPLSQPSQQTTGPTGATLGRGWSSPQASPVSGYDSSTSISSVYSGPEEDSSSSVGGGRPEQLKQQAIDSFYHDVTCRGDYRAVASKYNINRKYVEKWLQQKQEDDHHHASVALGSVRAPVIVG